MGCEDRQLLKHLFYNNISEWYSEVPILTMKDSREAETLEWTFQQKDGWFPERSQRNTECKYILIAIIPEWVSIHVQRISISINIIINCVVTHFCLPRPSQSTPTSLCCLSYRLSPLGNLPYHIVVTISAVCLCISVIIYLVGK